MSYVDGFIIPVPKKKLASYKAISKKAGKIWKEYGALDYKECVGDDLNAKGCLSFHKLVKNKKEEVIIFSYIVYKSKAHRNLVNKKIMKDSRIAKICDPNDMPFDFKKMAYGGFKVFVDVK